MPEGKKGENMSLVEKARRVVKSRAAAAALGTAIAVGTVSGEQPKTQFTSPEPSPTPSTALVKEKQPETEYSKRLKTLRSIPGNEQVLVWPNALGVDSPEKNPDQETINKNREIIKRGASLKPWEWGPEGPPSVPSDLTVEFSSEVQPTFRFFNARLQSEDKNVSSVFLDNSGRFKNNEGLTEIIDSIPNMNRRNLGYYDIPHWSSDIHVIGIPKESIPENGYVMVFSRPLAGAPLGLEKPNAKYDIWELDTAVFSDTTKLKSALANLTKEVNYFVIGKQDRTDRLTPFYNKELPAKVQKVLVVFDAKSKAVGKIMLDATEFSPRPNWLDTYQGNPALVNPDYVPPKSGETIQFSTFLKKMWEIRNEFGEKEFTLNVDEPGVEAGWPYLFSGDERLGEKTPAAISINVEDPKKSRLTLGFSLHLTRSQYEDFTKNWWGLKSKAVYPDRPDSPRTAEIPLGTKMRVKVVNGLPTLQEITIPRSTP